MMKQRETLNNSKALTFLLKDKRVDVHVYTKTPTQNVSSLGSGIMGDFSFLFLRVGYIGYIFKFVIKVKKRSKANSLKKQAFPVPSMNPRSTGHS